MKKTYIFLLIILLIIVVGVIIGITINKNNKEVPTSSSNVENNNEEQENAIDNNVENEINGNIENSIIDQEENQVAVQETVENEEEPKTSLEIAIDIVKKDWGEDSNVYFAEDGQTENGEYIICVRENSTTNALAWYTVNIKDGTFTKE